MKSAFIAVVLLWIASAQQARACDLDDCDLSDAAHLESPKYRDLPKDEFAWMNHDLALARSWLTAGRADKTLEIVAGLDYAMRVRLDRMVLARGKARVRALHEAVEDLEVAAGGYPLAGIELTGTRKRASAAPHGTADATASAPAEQTTSEKAERDTSDERVADRARRDSASRERTVSSDRREPPSREPETRPLPRP